MNHSAICTYELNSFKAFMKIKKLWSLSQSLLSKPYGVTMEIRLTALLSRSNNHCLGFYELESKTVEVNIYDFGLVFLKGS